MTFSDGSVACVKGNGTICALEIPRLDEVLYVEGLKANLICISQCVMRSSMLNFHKVCAKCLS